MSETPDIAGRKAILNLYGALAASLVLSVLPFVAAAVLSTVFFIGVLIAAYAIRKKAQDHSFCENHATYIIRTLWIAALLSLVTIGIAGAYMMGGIDYAPFESCANMLASKGIAWIESASTMAIYAVVAPCIDGFMNGNRVLLLNAVLIAGGPLMAYLAYRLIKGVARAGKGYRLLDAKTWL